MMNIVFYVMKQPDEYSGEYVSFRIALECHSERAQRVEGPGSPASAGVAVAEVGRTPTVFRS